MAVLDKKRPYVRYGGGPGRDVYLQNGNMFGPQGQHIKCDATEYQKVTGLPAPPGLRAKISDIKFEEKRQQYNARLEAAMEEARRKELARLHKEAGGEGDLPEDADIDILKELDALEEELYDEEEAAEPEPEKPRAKKATSKTKKGK